MSKRKTQQEFENELTLKAPGIFTDDSYVSMHKKMNFYCLYGHKWQAEPHAILDLHRGCPYCSGRLAIRGETDVWTLRPDVARMLKNIEDGYKYKPQSHVRKVFICPDCGCETSPLSLNQVSRYGLHCRMCSDSISYPNKFARKLLSQLDVLNVQHEWNPDWIKPYYFDNYFEYNNQGYILEMDGGIGHGKRVFGENNKVDVVGVERDKYKDKMAQQHGLIVVRIDCAYKTTADRFHYIHSEILNSLLSSVFNLSCVDWKECDDFARSSMVCRAAELYEEGYSTKQISVILNCAQCTIIDWLKQATYANLCNYIPGQRNSMYLITSVYTNEGELVGKYKSLLSASVELDLPYNTIYNRLKNHTSYYGDYVICVGE